MESLYVCLFSNGHIKVGRSIDPQSRIAAHADRVSCMGVLLSDQFTVECNGPAEPRESMLIARCATAAAKRNQQEWFVGLDFLLVCEWAKECALFQERPVHESIDLEKPDFRAILRFLKRHGMNQVDIASACNCSQPSISEISSGVTKDPRYSIGAALIALARERLALPSHP